MYIVCYLLEIFKKIDVVTLYFLYWTTHVHISLSKCAFAASGIKTCIVVSFDSFVSLIEILRQSNCKLVFRVDLTLQLRLTLVPAGIENLLFGIIYGPDMSEKELKVYGCSNTLKVLNQGL